MSHTIFFGLADVMGSIPLGLDGFIFSKGVLLLNFDGDLYVNCSVVSDALGYAPSSGVDAFRRFTSLDTRMTLDELIGSLALSPPDIARYKDLTTKYERSTKWVTETGIFELLIRSGQPKALQFQRYLTHDLLPRIRRDITSQAKLVLEKQVEEQRAKINTLEEQLQSLTLDFDFQQFSTNLLCEIDIERYMDTYLYVWFYYVLFNVSFIQYQ